MVALDAGGAPGSPMRRRREHAHLSDEALVALVARSDDDGEMVSVAKKSQDKISVGGRKYALRRRSPQGVAEAEVIGVGNAPATDHDDRSLLVQLIRDGEIVGREPLSAARDRHRAARGELPPTALQMSHGEPAIATIYEEGGSR